MCVSLNQSQVFIASIDSAAVQLLCAICTHIYHSISVICGQYSIDIC